MNLQEIANWACQVTNIFPPGARLEANEIGDGNVNYVYRVSDQNGNSVIVKNSADYIRGSSTRKLSTARADCEIRVLQVHGKLAPGFVPQIYAQDRERHLIAMEDLKNITMMRIPLSEWKEFPTFSRSMVEYLYRTLIGTSELKMPQTERRKLASELSNYPMCEISERLVFTEPYLNRQGLNNFSAEVAKFVQTQLYQYGSLQEGIARLKHRFQTSSEALIHGDLHTGSIFLSDDSIKIIDPEFGCFGPIGYDIGNVVGNLVFALAAWRVSNDAPKTFGPWIRRSIAEIIDGFTHQYEENWPSQQEDPMLSHKDFQREYLRQILLDTAGFAGAEILRRTVGVAKVAELLRVKDERRRALMESWLLRLGMDLVVASHGFLNGASWISRLEDE